MSLPFSIPRIPAMDRLNFLSSRQPHPAAVQDDDDDRSPLSPRSISSHHDDLEAQRTPEMAERAQRFRARFRPAIPSFFSVASTSRGQPRPSSSHYSGDGGPPDTVVNYHGHDDADDESPKTPRFRIGVQTLPSTRLHLPNLTRTWTQGSNGPPSRPGTGAAQQHGIPSPLFSRTRMAGAADGVTEPVPAVPAEHIQTSQSRSSRRQRLNSPDDAERHLAEMADDGRQRRRRRHRREGSDRSQQSSSSSSSGSGSGSGHRSHRSRRSRETGETNSDDRRRRRRRRRRRDGDTTTTTTTTTTENSNSSGSGIGRRPSPPKHFMFCFPWIKSRRIRSQILQCFVSGMFLTLLLTVYLALSITKNINNSEFTVLLILIILLVTIFFCHGLIRLCMLVMKGGRAEDEERAAAAARLPQVYGPGGYAIPRQPIRVVLARDEEAAGIESETTKINPPAYGLWRESVRVDPNRIYWQRNEEAPPLNADADVEEAASSDNSVSRSIEGSGSNTTTSQGGGVAPPPPRTTAPRPPSYASDDGVSYVVEAQPRSIAPTVDVPTLAHPHPSGAGRVARPSAW